MSLFSLDSQIFQVSVHCVPCIDQLIIKQNVLRSVFTKFVYLRVIPELLLNKALLK
jgi:hypothetical protein